MLATTRTGQKIDIADDPLAHGAAGVVHAAVDASRIVKFFKRPDPALRDALEAIVDAYRAEWFDADCEALTCWPTEIVERPQLGVVVPMLPAKMVSFAHLTAPTPLAAYRRMPDNRQSYRRRIVMALEVADAVRVLHDLGLCHSDLSQNNIYVDMETGGVCLIDLDGLVVPGYIPAQVLGTPPYIAPEIWDGLKRPSLTTDLHALAVLVHELVMFHHPLEGRKKFAPSDDLDDDRRYRFGIGAIWNHHPERDDNRPYDPMLILTEALGPLGDLFWRAFVEGVRKPHRRPSAHEWVKGLTGFLDTLQPCGNPACPAGWLPRGWDRPCWYCRTPTHSATSAHAWNVQALPHRDDQGEIASSAGLQMWSMRALTFTPEMRVYRDHLVPASPMRRQDRHAVGRIRYGKNGSWEIESELELWLHPPTGHPIRATGSVTMAAGVAVLGGSGPGSIGFSLVEPELFPPVRRSGESLTVECDDGQCFVIFAYSGGRGFLLPPRHFRPTGVSMSPTVGRVFWNTASGWQLRIYDVADDLFRDGFPLSAGVYPITVPQTLSIHGRSVSLSPLSNS